MSISNLETLAIGWKIAKEAEDEAKAKRLEIENQIIEAANGETKFFNIRIAYKDNRSWDNSELAALEPQIKPEFFPFRRQYKEMRSESKVIEKQNPKLWATLSGALTIKPAKPSFTWKESKDD